MAVHSLHKSAGHRAPSLYVPAIRTPDRYAEACEIMEALSNSMSADKSAAIPIEAAEQARAIKEAMDSCPFQMVEGQIVRKPVSLRVVN